MKVVLRVLSLTVLVSGLAGCGGAPQGPPETADSGSAGRNAAESTAAAFDSGAGNSTVAAASGPAEAVVQFYEALRRGSDVTLAALLTDRAREETAKSGLGIQSQASESLSYQISETDYVSERMDGAHVRTLWLEPNPEGQMTATEVIWVLRKQNNGWKISGMATPVVEGELPLLFNFEEPEDMLRKKEFVERQLAEPTGSLAETAEGPAPSAPNFR